MIIMIMMMIVMMMMMMMIIIIIIIITEHVLPIALKAKMTKSIKVKTTNEKNA